MRTFGFSFGAADGTFCLVGSCDFDNVGDEEVAGDESVED